LVTRFKTHPSNSEPDEADFENLMFQLIQDYPENISFTLGGREINFLGREVKFLRLENTPTPTRLKNIDLKKDELFVYQPLAKNFPDIDGILEFGVFDEEEKLIQKYLIFLQMTINSPNDHTNKNERKNFFINEDAHLKFFCPNWDTTSVDAQNVKRSYSDYEMYFMWVVPHHKKDEAIWKPKENKKDGKAENLTKLGESQIVYSSPNIENDLKEFFKDYKTRQDDQNKR